jgi:DNA primase large subunit
MTMNLDKISRLSKELTKKTEAEQIKWKLVHREYFPPLISGEGKLYEPWRTITKHNRLLKELDTSYVQKPWVKYTFSSSVVDEHNKSKVFRLVGKIYSIDEELESVKLQLYDKELKEVIYEFPSDSAFVELFQLVKNGGTFVADQFVDQFLQNSNTLESETSARFDNLTNEIHGLALNK